MQLLDSILQFPETHVWVGLLVIINHDHLSVYMNIQITLAFIVVTVFHGINKYFKININEEKIGKSMYNKSLLY